MTVTIWWIRRDLRLFDNPALHAAITGGEQVIPLFILDPFLLKPLAARRKAFLFDGLHSLNESLRQLGSRLVVRSGVPQEVFHRLMVECGYSRIYACEDDSPYARRRDAGVAASFPLDLLPGVTVFPPETVVKPDRSPYTVFTPYSRAWEALAWSDSSARVLPSAVPQSHTSLLALASEDLPGADISPEYPPGETEAQRRVEYFLSGPVYTYAEDRNRLDLAGTSQLSPYLRFGMLSPRQALALAHTAAQSAGTAAARKGVETWIKELIWRDFYHSILYHFPGVLKTAFNPALRSIPWRDAPQDLQAWKAGLTGYPVVDAAMRQLSETGWMHNRGRMIAASFLVKDLLIDWQEGERWFMQNLVDGDPAANNGGWQWTAGVGTDAAPYFRVFNPVLQSKKFDPSGVFIRRWLPELEKVPAEWLHSPWEMPPAVQRQCGFQPGVEYPRPIVDHAFARQRVLAAYSQARARSGAAEPVSGSTCRNR